MEWSCFRSSAMLCLSSEMLSLYLFIPRINWLFLILVNLFYNFFLVFEIIKNFYDIMTTTCCTQIDTSHSQWSSQSFEVCLGLKLLFLIDTILCSLDSSKKCFPAQTVQGCMWQRSQYSVVDWDDSLWCPGHWNLHNVDQIWNAVVTFLKLIILF